MAPACEVATDQLTLSCVMLLTASGVSASLFATTQMPVSPALRENGVAPAETPRSAVSYEV